jgi:hypothetical protein
MAKIWLTALFAFTVCISFLAVVEAAASESIDHHISFPSGITIYSPLEKTYNTNTLTLDIFLYSAGYINGLDPAVSLNYSIDGSINGPVPITKQNSEVHVVINAVAKLTLPPLSDGEHTLTLSLYGHNQRTHEPKYVSYVDTVHFSVDTGTPKVSILEPQNNTVYPAGAQITLNFTLSKPTSSIIYAQLDANRTVMAPQNTTLPALSAGQHNLTLMTLDSSGFVKARQTIQFTVLDPTPSATIKLVDTSQTGGLRIAVVVLAAIVVCLVLAAVTLKRKRPTSF